MPTAAEPVHAAVTTLHAVIVDDEPLARDCIRLALTDHPGVTVVAECGDGPDAVRTIRRLDPDIVFLDINLPGMTGFEVIDRVGLRAMPAVIFVTAYEDHAVHAFDVHAVDYLVKPFDDGRIREAVQRARLQLAARKAGELGTRIAALLHDFREDPPAPAPAEGVGQDRVIVRQDDRYIFVPTPDVDWLEAAGNNVRLHVGKAVYALRATLRGCLANLDARRFVRIHRSIVVNVDRIREVQPWLAGDYIAILQDGTRLKVSRTFRERLIGR